MLGDPDPAKAQRVMQAMPGMVKLDIAGLRAAYGGGPAVRPWRRSEPGEGR